MGLISLYIRQKIVCILPFYFLFSATAAKRSRGDVFRRETVLSDDLLCVCVCPNFFKV